MAPPYDLSKSLVYNILRSVSSFFHKFGLYNFFVRLYNIFVIIKTVVSVLRAAQFI